MAILVVVLGSSNRLIHHLQNVLADHFPLAQNTHAGSVSVQDVAIGSQLLELYLGQLHKSFDLVFRPVVVLNAEGIDSDDFDAAFVAYFHDLKVRNERSKTKKKNVSAR